MKPEVKQAIQRATNPKAAKWLDQEIERLEALLPQAKVNSPQWSIVVQSLTVAYQEGTKLIAVAAKSMGYSPHPWEWDDSAPIEAVAELHPGIEGTDWHQRMLGQIMMAPSKPHPWYTLPTEIYEEKPPAMKPELKKVNRRQPLRTRIVLWIMQILVNLDERGFNFCSIYIKPLCQKRIRPIYLQVFAIAWFFFPENNGLLLIALLFFPVFSYILDCIFGVDTE